MKRKYNKNENEMKFPKYTTEMKDLYFSEINSDNFIVVVVTFSALPFFELRRHDFLIKL